MQAALERLYRQFSVYPCPGQISVCEQCGPDVAADEIRATPLRALSLPQLVAIHVMALDDDALRYYFPRLIDLMLQIPSPVFDFRLADLKERIAAWQSGEVSAIRQLAQGVWAELSTEYPARLGYFSDSPSALDLLDWCGLPLPTHLDALLTAESVAAARHLADLVEAVFTIRHPFQTASSATVLKWMRTAPVGKRLEGAFFDAGDAAAARQLSGAFEVWTACAS
jgi:hypothetical protein